MLGAAWRLAAERWWAEHAQEASVLARRRAVSPAPRPLLALCLQVICQFPLLIAGEASIEVEITAVAERAGAFTNEATLAAEGVPAVTADAALVAEEVRAAAACCDVLGRCWRRVVAWHRVHRR